MIIIAEIGTAHEGSLEKAFEYIDAAAEAGADCVKFQWVYADEILHPDTGFVNLPGGKKRLYDTFKSLECGSEFFSRCLEHAHKKGLLFACSPFGAKSFEELASLNPDAIKIASPELNHFELLKKCAEYYQKIPLIISSGVSTLGDIEKAILTITKKTSGTFKSQKKLPDLTLLHCITFYPAPEEQYNVRCVKTLREIFGIPTGISDHSLNPFLVPVLTVLMDGKVIEKHITLSKSGSGLDDPIALEPEQFSAMVHAVNQAIAIKERYKKEGEAVKQNLHEAAQREIIRQLEYEFPEDKITAALGTGIKHLAPSEAENYGRTNRSLHYMSALKKGHCIQKSDISALRTEKILSPGISPEFAEKIQGAVLQKDVESGAGVQWEDFIQKSQQHDSAESNQK
ncbi:N-acetylneuraminate synthase family protein [Treponema sp.]|uniref:N-acetylneuraminate synthase family protein n=1 Tax=Treponema sp. TaxID=166 RepID=UPI003F10DAE5